jgi:hypothetical protein
MRSSARRSSGYAADAATAVAMATSLAAIVPSRHVPLSRLPKRKGEPVRRSQAFRTTSMSPRRRSVNAARSNRRAASASSKAVVRLTHRGRGGSIVFGEGCRTARAASPRPRLASLDGAAIPPATSPVASASGARGPRSARRAMAPCSPLRRSSSSRPSKDAKFSSGEYAHSAAMTQPPETPDTTRVRSKMPRSFSARRQHR